MHPITFAEIVTCKLATYELYQRVKLSYMHDVAKGMAVDVIPVIAPIHNPTLHLRAGLTKADWHLHVNLTQLCMLQAECICIHMPLQHIAPLTTACCCRQTTQMLADTWSVLHVGTESSQSYIQKQQVQILCFITTCKGVYQTSVSKLDIVNGIESLSVTTIAHYSHCHQFYSTMLAH